MAAGTKAPRLDTREALPENSWAPAGTLWLLNKSAWLLLRWVSRGLGLSQKPKRGTRLTGIHTIYIMREIRKYK